MVSWLSCWNPPWQSFPEVQRPARSTSISASSRRLGNWWIPLKVCEIRPWKLSKPLGFLHQNRFFCLDLSLKIEIVGILQNEKMKHETLEPGHPFMQIYGMPHHSSASRAWWSLVSKHLPAQSHWIDMLRTSITVGFRFKAPLMHSVSIGYLDIPDHRSSIGGFLYQQGMSHCLSKQGMVPFYQPFYINRSPLTHWNLWSMSKMV